MRTWIQGIFGQKLELFHPHELDLDIQDIAYALAGTNRFTARARPRVNVAEHSVRVSFRCEELAIESYLEDGGIAPGLNVVTVLRAARWGLMHDAAEAFLSDMAAPLKHQPEMRAYRSLEFEIMNVIQERYGLGPEPSEVKIADVELLATEARDCMQPLHPEWMFDRKPLVHVKVQGWPPAKAQRMFLDRFFELFPKERRK